MRDPLQPFRPGDDIDLTTLPAADDGTLGKDAAKDRLAEQAEAIGDLTWRLHAERTRALLVILQGMDGSGKDGTTDKVFRETSPTALRVASFKRPSDTELAHDFLWRIHAQCPERGQVTVFNRSQYEDVAVVRVHDLAPGVRWEDRFHHIREWERMLVENGTAVLKVFLHISREAQAERMRDRLENPEKHWKFNAGDLDERALWDRYQEVYSEALTATTTDHAPWYVVPADNKPYRNLTVARIVRSVLEAMNPKFPAADPAWAGLTVT